MSEPQVVTVTDLRDRAAQIIRQARETGQPVFITRYGRFTAVLIPLRDGEIEHPVLAEMARELADRAGEP